jgi:hypothetical protein
MPTVQQTPVYNPAQADLTSENAALFERIQRSQAYGVSGTRMVSSASYSPVRSALGVGK